MKVPAHIRSLHTKAKKARRRAHAPYSQFQVGAGLLSRSGQEFLGCNVENASFGATVCAERVAIQKAVSEGQTKFTDVVVVTDAPKPATPCALCLQVMAEFFDASTKIWVADTKQIKSVYEFRDLLPKPFGPKELQDANET